MKPTEDDAVLAITKSDSGSNSAFAGVPGILNCDSDKVFFLSGNEASTMAYGFAADGNATGADSNREDEHTWWLRSHPSSQNLTNHVVVVEQSGKMMYYGYESNSIYSRPAFNLYKNSVLFSSKAEGGKASGALGSSALKAVPDNSGREWKMTLKDTGRNFGVSDSACTGKKVYITYQDATPYDRSSAPNEYVSAIIKNEFGVITYYGRITKPESESGQISITLPDDYNGNKDELYVFSEQYNGDKYTDYASNPVEVSAVKDSYIIKYNIRNITGSNKQDYRRYHMTGAYNITLTATNG